MHAVVVTFEIKPAFLDPFRRKMKANAAASLDKEAGCRQFDVCEAAAGPTFLLYELYDDEAAFKAHLQSAHYLEFAGATADWIVRKQIDQFSRLELSDSGQED